MACTRGDRLRIPGVQSVDVVAECGVFRGGLEGCSGIADKRHLTVNQRRSRPWPREFFDMGGCTKRRGLVNGVIVR